MELIINSKKYGETVVYLDDEDYYLVSQHNWHIHKEKNKVYCNSIKYLSKRKYGKIGVLALKMHRVIMNVSDPKIYVDHIDGNGLNNRRNNLRVATHQQNMFNRTADKNSFSGLKGVYFVKNINKWEARISINKKQIIGGYFHTKWEAALKYNELAVVYHGEFAYLNNISNE